MSNSFRSDKRYITFMQVAPVILMVVILVVTVGDKVVRYARCTERTTGQIVSYREHWVTKTDPTDSGGYWAQIPTVRYQVDNIWYTSEPITGSSAIDVPVGGYIEIRYNSSNPAEFYFPEDSITLVFAVVVSVSACAVLSIVVVGTMHKLKRFYGSDSH